MVASTPAGRAGDDSFDDELDDDDLAWLDRILGRRATDTSTVYLCRPSRAQPQFLVPTKPGRVAAASLRRFHDARTPAERVAGLVGQAAGRFGLLKHLPGDLLELQAFALVDHLAGVLGEPELFAAVTLGPRRRNRKPVLQLVRPDGDVVGFAKIGWTPFTRELLENEARWLHAVEHTLPAWMHTPPVLHQTRWREFDVLVIGNIDTPFSARRRPVVRTAVVDAVASVVEPDRRPLADSNLVDSWRRVGLHDRIDLDRLLDRHGDTEFDMSLWHGDLTPWNMATRGGDISVWDWEFADGDRPVGFDVFHAHFEDGRRRRGETDVMALRQLPGRVAPQLHELGQAQRVEPMLDLYLAELLARECRLIGQGWLPSNMADLDAAAGRVLEERLAR